MVKLYLELFKLLPGFVCARRSPQCLGDGVSLFHKKDLHIVIDHVFLKPFLHPFLILRCSLEQYGQNCFLDPFQGHV